MRRFVIKYTAFILFSMLVMQSCLDNTDFRDVVYINDVATTTPVSTTQKPSNTQVDEETTISVAIEEHAFRIQSAENNPQKVKQLETWWDSLPHPVQVQIKSNEIDIELVSNIRTANQAKLDPILADSMIETTGDALEQIIGADTYLKYKISTTLVEPFDSSEHIHDHHATNIRLVKKVPVKLNRFKADFFLRNNEVSNDNIRALQYWWTNLPRNIQDKIKRQELAFDMTCHTMLLLEQEEVTSIANTAAQEYVDIMADILHRIVGVYKVNQHEFPVASIQTSTKFETMDARSLNLPANQFISIQLRKNKTLVKRPL